MEQNPLFELLCQCAQHIGEATFTALLDGDATARRRVTRYLPLYVARMKRRHQRAESEGED